jgi:hypothetical protein
MSLSKWKSVIRILGFELQRYWKENKYWHGDFSGHSFSDGGYEYRIKRVKK